MKGLKVLLFFIALTCINLAILLATQAGWKGQYQPSQFKVNSTETARGCNGPAVKTDSITMFVRMGAKREILRTRFYCIFQRLSVLFWPPSFGKTVVVLDQESEDDHIFGETLLRHVKKDFPDRTYEVLYEPLPKNPNVFGYNRQLWSSFFIDLYTNGTIIAWMDSDAGFGSPVTKASIFNGTKLRVLAYDCTLTTMNVRWLKIWARTTEEALGLPFVADFMIYFPVYIYRDTFTHCREYILKRFNTSHFEDAFKKFHNGSGSLSPVSIILSYAWYFEKERYDWNIKLCTDQDEYNKRFPAEHAIRPEDVENTLSVPQTAFHSKTGRRIGAYIRNSYCLSHEAAGNTTEKCKNYQKSLVDNLILFNHDTQRFSRPEPPCLGGVRTTCLQTLERHYKQVGLEIKQKQRKLDWKNVETVEKFAKELGIECENIDK